MKITYKTVETNLTSISFLIPKREHKFTRTLSLAADTSASFCARLFFDVSTLFIRLLICESRSETSDLSFSTSFTRPAMHLFFSSTSFCNRSTLLESDCRTESCDEQKEKSNC